MRNVPALVLKDLRRKRARPLTTVVMLLFPVIFSLIIGLAFGGGSGGGGALPPIDVLLADEDRSLLSQFLAGAGGRPQGGLEIRFVPVDRAEGEKRLAHGKASALLVIPKGFGDGFMAGRPETLLVRRNPAEAINPEVATQFVKVTALLLGSVGEVLAEPLAAIQGARAGNQAPPDELVSSIAVSVSHAIGGITGYVNPPLITLDTAPPADGKKEPGPGVMTISLLLLPGISIMMILMIARSAMGELLRERTMGTLRRIFATPVTTAEILVAKLVSSALLSGVAFVILGLVAVAWGARGVHPVALVVLAAAFIVSAVGFSSFVYGFARNERQGGTVAEIVILLMSFLGGSWIPLSSLGPGLRSIAPFTLNYWAVDGFTRVIFDHAGPGAILLNATVLAAIGIPGIVIGSLLLRRRLMGGA